MAIVEQPRKAPQPAAQRPEGQSSLERILHGRVSRRDVGRIGLAAAGIAGAGGLLEHVHAQDEIQQLQTQNTSLMTENSTLSSELAAERRSANTAFLHQTVGEGSIVSVNSQGAIIPTERPGTTSEGAMSAGFHLIVKKAYERQPGGDGWPLGYLNADIVKQSIATATTYKEYPFVAFRKMCEEYNEKHPELYGDMGTETYDTLFQLTRSITFDPNDPEQNFGVPDQARSFRSAMRFFNRLVEMYSEGIADATLIQETNNLIAEQKIPTEYLPSDNPASPSYDPQLRAYYVLLGTIVKAQGSSPFV